ncbi:MAG: GNAT family acetyltransferase [Halieaceae bacterium]
MSIEIRTFTESDRATVLGLWETCGLTTPWNDANKDIDRKVNYQPELFFVGVENGSLVASAMAGYDGHRGSVFYLAVHPDAQAKGYGQQLMEHIELVLEDIGCPKLNILVRSSNQSVLEFYDELSYSADDVVCLGKRIIPDA